MPTPATGGTPTCVEAEHALLGACLLAPPHAPRLLTGLTAEDFTGARAVAVYTAITTLIDHDTPPDPVAVLTALRRAYDRTGGRIAGVDAATVLADLTAACTTPAAGLTYRQLVVEYRWRRHLIATAARLDHAARTAEADTLRTVVADTATALNSPGGDEKARPRLVESEAA